MNEFRIFSEAQELSSPEARERFLTKACADNAQLRLRVEALLQSAEQASRFMESLPASEQQTLLLNSPETVTGKNIGPYKLREKLGEGGMGVVYVAEQREPLRRKVALKVIKPGMNSREVVARFEAERQALALMSHPNIAKVLDGGTTEGGLPFFVMELVKGIPITKFCDEHRLDIGSRLKLFSTICAAVQHAHQKGIIHRDLKPSNVLVELHDVTPIPKVIDFGVAKAINQQLTGQTVYTQYSQMIGTPLYMSPEQAQLSGLDVDTRSDIYSLGVILYELLTGTTPFDGAKLKEAGFDEMRRIIREDAPLRPSSRVSTLKNIDASTVSTRRQTDPRQLAITLKRELDWVCMKAMEKDRTRRYESASAMAADIQNFLVGAAVEACPPTLRYRTRKFALRHKGVLLSVGLIVITALAGTVASLNYARRAGLAVIAAAKAQAEAEDHATKSQSLAQEASDASQAAAAAAEAARIAGQRETARRTQAEQALYVSDVRVAASQIREGYHSGSYETLLRQRPQPNQTDRRGWEWYYLLNESIQSELSFFAQGMTATVVDWNHKTDQIASCCRSSNVIQIWDSKTGLEIKRLEFPGAPAVYLKWSPTGRELFWSTVSGPARIWKWDMDEDSMELVCEVVNSVWSFAVNADASRIVAGSITGRESKPENIRFWKKTETNTWKIEHSLAVTGNILRAALSHDGRYAGIAHGTPGRIIDLATFENSMTVDQHIYSVACHPSRDLLVFGTWTGECISVDLQTMQQMGAVDAHFVGIRDLAFSPNGDYLATTGVDGTLKIWDHNDGALIAEYHAHNSGVTSVCWNADSTRIATAGYLGEICVWPLRNSPKHSKLMTNSDDLSHFFWTERNLIRTVEPPGNVIEREPMSQRSVSETALQAADWVLVDHDIARTMVKEPDGGEKAYIVDLRNFSDPMEVSHLDPTCATCSRVGRKDELLFISQPKGKMFSYSFPEVRTTEIRKSDFGWIRQISTAPNHEMFAVAGGKTTSNGSGVVILYDSDSYSQVNQAFLEDRVFGRAVAWSKDSASIATATDRGVCEVFRVPGLERIANKRHHFGDGTSIDWHPDNKRIASGGADRRVVVWDAQSGEALVQFSVDGTVVKVQWSPDGMMLAAKDNVGTIHIWNAQPGYTWTRSAHFAEEIHRELRSDFNSAGESENLSEVRSIGLELAKSEYTLRWYYYYYSAIACLEQNDMQGYRRLCSVMLEHCNASSDDRYITAWAHVLVPELFTDYSRVIELVETDARSGLYLSKQAYGAALLRAKRFTQAEDVLTSLLDFDASNSGHARLHFLLAILNSKTNDREQAGEFLKTGNEYTELALVRNIDFYHGIALDKLRSEAREAVGALQRTDSGH